MFIKKFIVVMLVITCILSITVLSYADVNTSQKKEYANNTGALTDISNHWAKNNIEKLIALKAINGYQDGTFKPNQTITRAEFLKIAMLAVDPTLDTTSEEGAHWCSGILKSAYDKHVLYDNELSSSSEELDQPITRNEMARILVRINELIQKESDVSVAGIENLLTDYQAYPIKSEYLPYVAKAYMKGLLSGYSDGSFHGERQGTRAEATTMILRLLDKSSRVAVDTTKIQKITSIINDRGQMVQTEVKKYSYQAFSQTKIYTKDNKYYASINLPSLPNGFLWYARLSSSMEDEDGTIIYYSILDPETSIALGATGFHIYEVKGLTTEQVKDGAKIHFDLQIVTPDVSSVTSYYSVDTSTHDKIYESSEVMDIESLIDYDTSEIFNSADWVEWTNM